MAARRSRSVAVPGGGGKADAIQGEVAQPLHQIGGVGEGHGHWHHSFKGWRRFPHGLEQSLGGLSMRLLPI
jgi:hypothetical protein